jgi:hypothetical protein
VTWVDDDMAWAAPQYDRAEVNRAGKCLVATSGSTSLMERDRMLEVINNWRSSHSFPLQCLKMGLLRRAKAVDPKAIIAQRLKRLPSIDAKLRLRPWMNLTQMQDIGGVRAIVRSVVAAEKLVEKFTKGDAKNPKRGHQFHKRNDYIQHPKEDGYRSYHLVYRYRSMARKHRGYNDLKIEIQIRSRLQHAWATAVETVQTFTGQALKSSGGEKDWRRFFALMGTAISLRERRPPVPNTPTNKYELVRELRELNERLNVETVLHAWRVSVKELPSKVGMDTSALLLYLDPEKRVVKFTPFTVEKLPKAHEAYLSLEKKIAEMTTPGAQAVLVWVNSLQSLRRAYPNYYLDTTVFVEALEYALKMARTAPADPRQRELFQAGA